MNILPKKRWHVRTKDNIARVRRDEALAAEEERKRQQRLEKAEREAKREALRKKAREQYGFHSVQSNEAQSRKSETEIETDTTNEHVNLFYELEQNEVVSNKTNEEHEREKQLEKEKYEKQIGYLTYLGQDTNEITGKVSWYNKPRKEHFEEQEEVYKKQKAFEDPLESIKKFIGTEEVKKSKSEKIETKPVESLAQNLFKKYLTKEKHKKHKKDKKSKKKKKKKKHSRKYSSESEVEVVVKKEPKVDLERLRAERLKREREEKRKAEELLAKLNGVSVKKEEVVAEPLQKYNSQFNPHLAKQNYNY